MTAPLDLDALKAKALAATRGPWEVQTDKHPHFRGGAHTEHRIRTAWIHGQLKDHYPVVTTSVGIPEFENGPACRMVAISKADAEHIAAASPAVMLELLARLERADGLVEAGVEIMRAHTDAVFKIGDALGLPQVATVERVLQAVKALNDRLDLADANVARLNSNVSILSAQSEALHLVAHAIGVPAGEDVTKAVLPAVKALVAAAKHEHSCHRDGDITFTMSMRIGDKLFRSGRDLNGLYLASSVDEAPSIRATAEMVYRDLKRAAAEGGAA